MPRGLLFAFVLLSNLVLGQSVPFIIKGSAVAYTGTPPYPNYSGCGCYQITPNQASKAGAVYNNNQIDLSQPFDFNFWVYFGTNSENTANLFNQNSGADGMGFVLTRNVSGLAAGGGGMGFGYLPHAADGSQSLAVEYDIFSNPKTFANGGNFDPPYPTAITQYEGNEIDHVALDIDGGIDHWPGNPPAVQANATNKNIEDGAWHTTRLVWDPATQNLTVYFDGVQRFTYTFSANVVSTYFTGNPLVNWGWTGATGAKFNEQRVCMNFTPNFTVVNGVNKKVCSNVVQFQDSSTSSLNKIIGWDWDFGDASAHATTANPTHTFSGPGTYTVTLIITDQSGCQATKSYPVTVAPITIAGTVTPVTCSGGTNGGVTTTVSGGSGVYTSYTWSNAAATQSISNVAAGTYTITVQDNTGCTNSNTFTLTDPAALAGSLSSKTDVACFGQSTGAATVSATGGSGTYTVNWAPGSKTGLAVTGLSAGSYTATISQAGCTQTVQVPVTIAQPATALSATSAVTGATCTVGGTATVTPAGGTSPYTISWSDGNTNLNRTNLSAGKHYFTVTDGGSCSYADSVTISSSSSLTFTVRKDDPSCTNGLASGKIVYTVTGGTAPFTFVWSANTTSTIDSAVNLSAGNYSTTITDNSGCSVSNTVTINPAVQALSFTVNTVNKKCNGGVNDGKILYGVSGGTSPYTYVWSANASSTVDSAVNLDAGVYDVTITDMNGCSVANSATITQPAIALSIAASGKQDITCFGANNGQAFITLQGGTTGYTYSWTPAVTSGATASNLSQGTYTVTGTDANGCSVSTSFAIVEPTVLSVTSSKTDLTCNQSGDGSITITAIGGTPAIAGYTYAWVPNAGTTGALTGLAAGTYQVTVTDSMNCSVVETVVLTEPQAVQLTAQVVDEPCFNDAKGTITPAANGGVPNYIFSIEVGGTFVPATGSAFTLLPAGTYNVKVTDGNSCEQINAFTINQPAAILATFANDKVKCFGESNGAIHALANGGTPVYTYTFSNGTQNKMGDATSLNANTYTVTITDAMGCSMAYTTVVEEPAAVGLVATSVVPVDLTLGDSKALEVTSNYSNAVYQWTPATGLSCTNCPNPTVTIYNSLQYQVTASVSPHGKVCSEQIAFPVQVTKNYTLYVPNAFTPNADGVNDMYEVFGNKKALKFIEFMVFNRWGEMIYKSNDIDFTWDGKFKGDFVGMGVYTYQLHVTFMDGYSDRDYRGTITVIR